MKLTKHLLAVLFAGILLLSTSCKDLAAADLDSDGTLSDTDTNVTTTSPSANDPVTTEKPDTNEKPVTTDKPDTTDKPPPPMHLL